MERAIVVAAVVVLVGVPGLVEAQERRDSITRAIRETRQLHQRRQERFTQNGVNDRQRIRREAAFHATVDRVTHPDRGLYGGGSVVLYPAPRGGKRLNRLQEAGARLEARRDDPALRPKQRERAQSRLGDVRTNIRNIVVPLGEIVGDPFLKPGIERERTQLNERLGNSNLSERQRGRVTKRLGEIDQQIANGEAFHRVTRRPWVERLRTAHEEIRRNAGEGSEPDRTFHKRLDFHPKRADLVSY